MRFDLGRSSNRFVRFCATNCGFAAELLCETPKCSFEPCDPTLFSVELHEMRPLASLAAAAFAAAVAAQSAPLVYTVNVDNVTSPWFRTFSECVGSGHAALALRADYQQQMAAVRRDVGFKRVRMHGLLADDMSVALPAFDADGVGFYFFNVYRAFDALLAQGVRPLVEISFTPALLASGNQTWSHWDANVTPPKNYTQWAELITSLGQALVDRYGLEEVLTWNFEIWNEPNCCGDSPVFWTGGQQGYFELFAITSRALKAVDPGMRVGGL